MCIQNNIQTPHDLGKVKPYPSAMHLTTYILKKVSNMPKQTSNRNHVQYMRTK